MSRFAATARLQRHPATPCAAVEAIVVEMERTGSALGVRYVLTGEPAALLLPPPEPPARADGLWRHTCFEAFVRPEPGEGYGEFNLAPSRRWAAYGFDGYREGMAALDLPGAPAISVESSRDGLVLQAQVETGLAAAAGWRVGLSAVIEEVGGRISYWALAHPAGRPDFHHPDCFALQLPNSGRP